MKKINTDTPNASILGAMILLLFVIAAMPYVFAVPNHEQSIIKSNDDRPVPTNTPQKPKRKKKIKVIQKKIDTAPTQIPAGLWGGDGVIFEVKEKSVNIQYGCADGRIEQALTMDAQGNFSVNGYYTRQSGGPVLIDSPPVKQNVRYEGKITGDKLRLKITLTASKEMIGEFNLQRGNTPEIARCY